MARPLRIEYAWYHVMNRGTSRCAIYNNDNHRNTQRYNRLEKRDGSLFRGRYKAILIDAENYLVAVSRYIHRNPVEAGVCSNPRHYASRRE
jgi:REP element-mobilizing transposase RayT